jgi:hypothetical protein
MFNDHPTTLDGVAPAVVGRGGPTGSAGGGTRSVGYVQIGSRHPTAAEAVFKIAFALRNSAFSRFQAFQFGQLRGDTSIADDLKNGGTG